MREELINSEDSFVIIGILFQNYYMHDSADLIAQNL